MMPEIEMFLKINSLYSVSLSVMNKENASVLHAASFIFLKTQWGLDWGITDSTKSAIKPVAIHF